MAVVLLRLGGPLQSWGASSRFVRRQTESAPTKSGILGLVAAAQGRRRSDPIEDLVGLRLGVRLDQPGHLVRDFQTAIRRDALRDGSIDAKSMPLSYRFYLGDAVFLAALEGDAAVIEGIDEAVRSPHFSLYLGRRSCPPDRPVALGTRTTSLETALADHPWLAASHVQRRSRDRSVLIETVCDAKPNSAVVETLRDHPLSFDPNRRLYAWRRVVRDVVSLPNPYGSQRSDARTHDPMSVLGE